MATPEAQVAAIIADFQTGLDKSTAIDRIVAIYPPGRMTRKGAELYLDRGTTQGSDLMAGLLPGLPAVDDDSGARVDDPEDGARN